MTVLLLGVGAAVAGAGSRFAALAFLAAAVAGTREGALAGAATWIPAAAAVWAWLGPSPRRLALPAVGAAAALAAAGANNATVVLAVWALGTGAAVVGAGFENADARRWSISLCAADIAFAAAVLWTVARVGFEVWPGRIDGPAAVLLLVAAAARVPLVAGSNGGRAPGVVAVRAQVVVLLFLVTAAQGIPRSILQTAVVLGATGFCAAALAPSRDARLAAREAALLGILTAGARLGWAPAGWSWAVLAGGTLTYNLRFVQASGPPGEAADAMDEGDWVALPLLPAVVATLEGASRVGGWLGALILLGIVAGIGLPRGFANRDRLLPWRPEVAVLSGAFVAMAIGAALWAPALTLPRPPAAHTVAWPPAWAAAVVVAAGVVGTRLVGLVREPRAAQVERLPTRAWLPSRLARSRVVVGALAAFAAIAMGMWIVGAVRGFL